ncbi:hypothetical protein K469DRAFT_699884 [Zopfia rhizophila CBS 207.26]|uniref:Uncharacterized protein n=1 Tax=Zopfia rhizophila CBS 207.26 TaxID=1314779 RepID=A0A6A6EG50_9PEZI|nr:hypothetical protein K469DRAFT_699884 [Zopfia rhizophila CBS 207.26]
MSTPPPNTLFAEIPQIPRSRRPEIEDPFPPLNPEPKIEGPFPPLSPGPKRAAVTGQVNSSKKRKVRKSHAYSSPSSS